MDLHSIRSDEVIVKGIQFEAAVGLDIWHRPHKPQPVVLEIHLTPYGGLEACANEDSVAHTIDYGKLYKALKAGVFGQNFESVTKLYQAIKQSIPETPAWLIRISLPKAILAAREGVEFTWTGETDSSGLVIVLQQMKIPGIECNCIIGVNSHERLEKQRLSIDIVTTGLENRLSQSMHAGVSLDPSPRLAYQDVTQEVVEVRSTCQICRYMLILSAR